MAKLLIIDGRLRQKTYYRDRDTRGFARKHFYDAYHAIAKEVVSAETPDEMLENMIPSMVQHFKLKQGWLPYMHFDTLKRCLEGPVNEWKGKRLLMKISPPETMPVTSQMKNAAARF